MALPGSCLSTPGLCDSITTQRVKAEGTLNPSGGSIRNIDRNSRDSVNYQLSLGVRPAPSQMWPVTQAGRCSGHLAPFRGSCSLSRPGPALNPHSYYNHHYLQLITYLLYSWGFTFGFLFILLLFGDVANIQKSTQNLPV